MRLLALFALIVLGAAVSVSAQQQQPFATNEQQHVAAAGSSIWPTCSGVAAGAGWANLSLPTTTVMGAPDVFSCHTVQVPSSLSPDQEIVGVRLQQQQQQAGSRAGRIAGVLLLECPQHLWFLASLGSSSQACSMYTSDMLAACSRWWVSAESPDFQTCTPPGLMYNSVGQLTSSNRVLILQLHWTFGPQAVNASVTLANTTLQLLHRKAQPGRPSEVMETLQGAAATPPAPQSTVNSLAIPAGQPQFTAAFACAKRCTFAPLGGLSPRPVSVVGVSLQGGPYVTGMRVTIKRCSLTRLPDVSWEVDRSQQQQQPSAAAAAQQPRALWDVRGQDIKLYPGDTISWACTWNTSGLNRTLYGGPGQSQERCDALLHYYPRNAMLRGCRAVSREQGGHSKCAFEAAQTLDWQSANAGSLAISTDLSPRTLPPLGAPQGLNVGYKASIVVFWMLLLTAFLWGLLLLLLHARCLGRVRAAFRALSHGHRRNIPIYAMHVVLDTVMLGVWFEPLFGGWCGCTESAPGFSWLTGFVLLYVVVSYGLELVWRSHVDAMLAIHHVTTIVAICVLLGELPAMLYQFADAFLLLAAFALLEQPTFVALLLQRLLPASSVHVVRAWKTAVWFWFVSKTLSVLMAVWLIVRDWGLMPGWVRGLYICLWALVYGIQLWSGMIQLSISRRVASKYRQQRFLPTSGAGVVTSAKACSGGAGAGSSSGSGSDSSSDSGSGDSCCGRERGAGAGSLTRLSGSSSSRELNSQGTDCRIELCQGTGAGKDSAV